MKKHARVGLIIVIRSTISSDPLGEYDYILDEITELNPRRGSFYTATPTTWYSTDRGSWYYTGQSTDTPTGKIDLCMPTPALVRAAIQQETGFLPREHHRTLVERAREQSIALFAADPLA